MIGSIISIGLLVAAGYYWATFRNINNGLSRIAVAVGANPSGSKHDIDGTDQNILVVGNDDRSTMTAAETKELGIKPDGGSLATDTMMIVHVPANGKKATLISLPRDTVVDIPDGFRRNKLNSPYASAYVDARNAGKSTAQARLAGSDLLVKTITNLTGLTIDHYVQVDLLGFYRITKAIGGITVDLCKNVDDRVSTNRATGEGGGSGFYMTAGKHTLNAAEALAFVRQRHHLAHGDLDRVKRQQYFLTAAFRSVASTGILIKLNAVGNALQRSLYFDNSLNLIDLAHQLENLTANNIVGKTIPTATAGGEVTADPAKVQQFVGTLIANTNSTAPKSTAPADSSGPKSAAPSTPAPSKSAAPIDSKCIY